jgi:hypothetical protein
MNLLLKTHQKQSVTHQSFFDLPRAAIIRDTPAKRLRKAAKGTLDKIYIYYIKIYFNFNRG